MSDYLIILIGLIILFFIVPRSRGISGGEDGEFYSADGIKKLSSRELLIRTLYGEARGESNREIALVGEVIRNRKNSTSYSNSYQGVILQPYQFSCWNHLDRDIDKIPNNNREVRRVILTDNKSRVKCETIADLILRGAENNIPDTLHFLYDPKIEIDSRGVVTSSYAPWAVGKEVTYRGKHTFLKRRG